MKLVQTSEVQTSEVCETSEVSSSPAIIYNDALTLRGIPSEALDYRLGNKSALHWLVDQYQVSTDPRSGITNDPNRADEPEYIVNLIKKLVTVSVETVKILRSLPECQIVETHGRS